MADNVVANAGSGGATFATDDIGGIHYPITKITLGALDSQTLLAGGAGAVTAGVPRVTLASDDPAVALLGTIDTDTSALAGAVSGTEMQVDIVTSALPSGAATQATLADVETNTDFGATTGNGTAAGALRVTVASDSTGVLSVDDGGGALTVDGTVTANLGATDNAVLDNIDTQTSPGVSHYRNIDANAEAEIKGSAGTLFWLHAMNMTAAVAYVHLYDATAASVTPGTTTPTYTFPLPTQGDTNGVGVMMSFGANGQAFANGITLVVTTTVDGSAGDPGTNGVFVNAGYS